MQAMLEVATGKKTTRWRLDDDALVREADGSEERTAWADVVEVRIAAIGDNGSCELYLRDGRRVVIATAVFDDQSKQQINAYNELVRALHQKLAGRQGIRFRAGSLFGAIAVPAIGLVLAGALFVLHRPLFAWISSTASRRRC
jgi:hypothetical protein